MKIKIGQNPLDALNDTQPNPAEYRWSTFMPRRTPKLKVHRHIGHAKNALGTGDWWKLGCKVYELNNGVWDDVTDAWIEITKERQVQKEKERLARQEEYHKRYHASHPCPYCFKSI